MLSWAHWIIVGATSNVLHAVFLDCRNSFLQHQIIIFVQLRCTAQSMMICHNCFYSTNFEAWIRRLIVEATKAQKSQSAKKFPAERFLLIWYPLGPTYHQKKTPRDPTITKVIFWLVFKMAALIYCEKMKKGKMINYTTFPTFLGSRNPIKILF